MSRVLTIDVGAGTMDVLYFDTESAQHYKAVVRSPVRTTAERILAAEGRLLIIGREMGGGAVTAALKRRVAAEELLISEAAAMTISHDLERVRSQGFEVIDSQEARRLEAGGEYAAIELTDIETDRVRGIVEGFGVAFDFDVVGVCVQDHGAAPPGVSHLDYRHRHYRPLLDARPTPDTLLYGGSEVPGDMSRLLAVREAAQGLPTSSIYVMDSGMAAILGATLDPRVRACERAIVLDVATSHTIAASFEGDELCGFVEYHTSDVRLERLESLLPELANGKLEHAQVLAEGGHGAYTRRALGFDAIEIILATGPRRALLAGSSLEIVPGAPLGDNMMTGAVGLLEAIRRRERWEGLSLT